MIEAIFNTPLIIPIGCLSGSIIHLMIKDIINYKKFNIPIKKINEIPIKEFNNIGFYFGGIIGITRFYYNMPILYYLVQSYN